MVAYLPADAGDVRDAGWIPGSEDPLEEGVATHSNILAWRIPGQRSLEGYSPLGHKESDMPEGTQPACIVSILYICQS